MVKENRKRNDFFFAIIGEEFLSGRCIGARINKLQLIIKSCYNDNGIIRVEIASNHSFSRMLVFRGEKEISTGSPMRLSF